MGLTRKKLAAMGLEADKIEEIIQGHSETVSALKDELESARAEAEKASEQIKKLEGKEKQLEDLKAKVAAEAKEREGKDYDALKNEFEAYKADVEHRDVRARKEAAYKELLRDAGIPERHFKKIIKYSDVDGIEIDDEGKPKGAKELLKAIREEWNDHIQVTETKGATTTKPPASTGGKMTREEIDAIKDTATRQKAMLENHELYGI